MLFKTIYLNDSIGNQPDCHYNTRFRQENNGNFTIKANTSGRIV